MKARVLVQGQFHGQTAEVIGRDKKGNYHLATMWREDLLYPAWFSPEEIELIQEEETPTQEKGEQG